MAWTTPSATHLTGDVITAAWANILENNFAETAPAKVTTQGDTVYATAANTLARLAKGTARQVLKMNAGATAPEWGPVVPASDQIMGAVDANYHIEQGTGSVVGGGVLAVTFTNAYTTALAVVLGMVEANEAQNFWVTDLTTTGFNLHGTNGKSCYWIAVGQD